MPHIFNDIFCCFVILFKYEHACELIFCIILYVFTYLLLLFIYFYIIIAYCILYKKSGISLSSITTRAPIMYDGVVIQIIYNIYYYIFIYIIYICAHCSLCMMSANCYHFIIIYIYILPRIPYN